MRFGRASQLKEKPSHHSVDKYVIDRISLKLKEGLTNLVEKANKKVEIKKEANKKIYSDFQILLKE
jgi:hypothetical protein